MIETILIDYLNDMFEQIPTYAEEPLQASSKYFVIEKTAGKIANHIESATVAIKSYAPSMYEAAELNGLLIDAMERICELNSVSSCKLNSNYNYTDTTKKKYRYQAVYDLVYFDLSEDNNG